MEPSHRLKDGLIFIWCIFSPLLLYFLISILVEGVAVACGVAITADRVLTYTMIKALGAAVPLWILYKQSGAGGKRRVSWNGKTAALVILFGCSVCIFVNNLLSLSGWTTKEFEEASALIYQPPIRTQIVSAGLVIPVTEELIFRGLGFGRMRSKVSFLPAALISALFFGWFHGNLIQGIYGFLLGIALAWVYELYGNIGAPILFHIAANLLSIGLTHWNRAYNFPQSMAGFLSETVIAGCLVVFLWKKMKESVN